MVKRFFWQLIIAAMAAGCWGWDRSYLAAQPELAPSFTRLSMEAGLPADAVPSDMLEDAEGYIWIAYESGLYRYDGYMMRPVPASLQDSTQLAEFGANTLFLDRRERVWVGTRNLGVSRYDPALGRFDRLLPQSIGGVLPAGRIWDIWQADDRIYWLATETGLVRWDDAAGSATRYTFPDTLADATSVAYINTIRSIAPDATRRDRLWLGTRYGLWAFDIPAGRFLPHAMPYSSSEIGLLPYPYMILHLVPDGDSALWAGTWGGGLMSYHIPSGRWSRYRNDRVPADRDIFYHISRRDDTTLWIGTTFDAGVFDCRGKTFSFLPRDASISGGTAYSEYFGAMLATREGYLCALNTRGLLISGKPVATGLLPAPRPPVISRLEINQQPVGSFGQTNIPSTIRLERRDAYLLGEVTRPSARSDAGVTYRHRLIGYDPDWIDQGTSRQFQYARLPPGTYTLAFAARLPGQDWVDGTVPLTVSVVLPWWQRGWVWALTGGLLLLLVFWSVGMRVRQIRRESRLRETFARRLAENEMTALRAQMNPHFLFNSLNSIKNFILRQDTDLASHYLNQFSRLMRSILHNSARSVVPLAEELEALRMYIDLELMRLDGGFQVQWDIDPAIDPRRIQVPPLLIQPYVENAIWHGLMPAAGDRRLFLSVRQNDGEIAITIRDNGVGRAAANGRMHRKARSGAGMGMQITRDRIELLRITQQLSASVTVRDLADTSGSPSGTEVTIRLPVRLSATGDPLPHQANAHG